jgi:NAD(P)-dependent dehydrogenase (short-subunit alcohol dehydrogenase family)
MNICIIGSTGAIGNAFLEYYIADNTVTNIYSFSRSKLEIDKASSIKNFQIDIENEDSIKKASEEVRGVAFDLVIVATGILYTDEFGPEKSIRDLSFNKFEKIFKANTVGPAIIGKYFLPLLNKSSISKMCFLSAKVGSISDNRLGGWYSYRASKTALNQIIKNFSIEISRSNKQAIIVGLQPGTVSSKLSEPFTKPGQSNLFTPEESVRHLVSVIDELEIDNNGSMLSWDGSIIQP